jgi:hypothetical protein
MTIKSFTSLSSFRSFFPRSIAPFPNLLPYLCLLILLFPAFRASAQSPPNQSPSQVSFTPVQTALEKSAGSLTPEVRAAYLDWSELTVLQSLSNAHQPIPADCIAEVQADPTLRDAMFAAIDPPDPSILQNYASLRAVLGAPFTAKYRSLIIAEAVATRTNGARVRPDPDLNGESAAPSPSPGSAPQPTPDPLVTGIASYMKQTGVTSLQLFQSQPDQQKLTAFLQSQKIDPGLITKINKPDTFHNLLKKALVALDQRPPHRTPPPDAAAWLRYLTSIYEATPGSMPTTKSGDPIRWPRFPIDRAPWPLLMPLHHAYPLDEAAYIWEKYQGLHGPTRYHTYGPYESGSFEWVRELQPSPWHWTAWPDVIVHGGECTTMAPMSVESHVTLGVPAVMAGQPGHCNLMSFNNSGGFWYTSIEQAFAGGPDVTEGSWLFNEIGTAPGLGVQNNRPWASSEYHIGLAQSMNVGLRQYIDTRIAVSLYHHLPKSELATLGTALLTQAIRTNPYNPAPWYLLGKQTASSTDGIALVKMAMQDAQAEEAADQANAASPTPRPVQSPAPVALPKPVASSVRAYWRVIEERLAKETILKHPLPKDQATVQDISDFLKTVPGISDAQEMPYILDSEGSDVESGRLQEIIEQHIEGVKGIDKKSAEKRFATDLKAFLHTASKDDGDALLTRLKATLPTVPTDDPYLLIVEAAKPKSK